MHRSLILTTLLVVLMVAPARPKSGKDQPAEDSEGLRIGFSAGLFGEVSGTDAAAATQVWASELKRKRGFRGKAEATVFENGEAIVKAVKNKQIDLSILLIREYLELRDEVPMEPCFVPQRGSQVYDETLLLVHRASGIEGLDGLKGRSLVVMRDARGRLGSLWLETLLMSRGFGQASAFFGSVREVTKSSRAILPVFFKQADGCLVPRSSFEIITEMNPQLHRDLKVIGVSPASVPSVLSVRPDYSANLKEALLDALAHLHEEPRGQQILMIFKVDRLTPFRESYMDTARTLIREYRKCQRDQMAGIQLHGKALTRR